MRAVIAIVVIVVILALLGWVTFSRDPGRSSVTVETEKIERDIQGLSDSVQGAGEEIRQNASDMGSSASP